MLLHSSEQRVASTRLLFLFGLALTLLVAQSVDAAPARFWLSLSPQNPYAFAHSGNAGSMPGVPHLVMNPDQTANVFLWAQPQTLDAGDLAQSGQTGMPDPGGPYDPQTNPFRQLVALSLDFRAAGSAQVTGVELANPRADAPTISDDDARFQVVVDSAHERMVDGIEPVTYPVAVDDNQDDFKESLNGVLAFRAVQPVAELGAPASTVAPPTAGIGGLCTPVDGCVNGPNGPAWRLGRVQLSSASEAAAGSVQLLVGSSGMGHVGEIVDANLTDRTPGTLQYVTQAAFGAPDGPIYNTQDYAHRSQFLSGDTPDLQLSIVAPLYGDYNADGVVDAADYTVYRDLAGADAYLPNRDSTGMIGPGDLALWIDNYGDSRPSNSAGEAVPEPNAAALFVLFLVLASCVVPLMLRGRRRLLTRSHKFGAQGAVAILLLPSLIGASQAQRLDWREATSGNWGANNNWIDQAGNVGFEDGRVMRFSKPGVNGTFNVNLRGSGITSLTTWNPQGITFNQTGTVTILPGPNNGNSLAIGSQGITVDNSSGVLRTRVNLSLRTDQTWNVPNASGGSDPLLIENGTNFNSTVSLGAFDLTVNGPGNTRIQSQISGSGRIYKRGEGRLSLGGANSFTGGLQIDNGSVRITSDANLGGVNNPIIMSGGKLDINGSITIDNPFTIDDTVDNVIGVGTFNATLSGSIGGSGAWQKQGSGRLTLSGNNGASGFLAIAAGEVLLTNANSLNSGAFLNESTTLWVSSSGTFDAELHSATPGAGVFRRSGSGRLTLTKSTTANVFGSGFSGTYRIDAGQIAATTAQFNNRPIQTYATTAEAVFLGSGSYNGATSGAGKLIKEQSGTLTLRNLKNHTGGTQVLGGKIQGDTTSLRGGFYMASGAELVVDSGGTFSGTTSGAGAFRKSGSGNLTLGVALAHTGATYIDGGTLIGSTSVLPNHSSAQTYLAPGAELLLSQPPPDGVLYNAIIDNGAGSRTLTKRGAGGIFMAGTNNFTGVLNIEQGTISGNGSTLSSAGTSTQIASGATIAFIGSGNVNYNQPISGGGRVVMNKNPWNVLTLGGANSYTGGTVIDGGKVLGNTNSIRGPVTMAANTSVVFEQLADGVFSGGVSGNGSIVKRGPGKLTLNAPHNYSGVSLGIEEGELEVRAGGLKTDVLLSAGSNLRLAATASYPDQTYAHTISGAGSIEKYGNDTVKLEGTQLYTGGTSIAEGALLVNGQIPGDVSISAAGTLGGSGVIEGSVSGPGRVAPGNSPGILTINGDYTMSTGSLLDIEVDGASTAGVDYDQLRVGRQVSLGGTLNFDFTDFASPAIGDRITFVETFGGGEVLPTTPTTRPKLTTAGIDPGSNLAVRVESFLGVGGKVDMVVVPRGNVSFDGVADVSNWFTDVDWFSTDPMNNNDAPDGTDDTLVGGNVFVEIGVPQRVIVNNSIMNTPDVAEVRQLRIGDTAQDVVVEVETALHSVTGDITIADHGAIELDGGAVSVNASRMVKVVETGMLMGNGSIGGRVEVGMTPTDSSVLSPGMRTSGMEVGVLTITDDYTQGAGGVFAVDITDDGGGTNNDFIDVDGAMTLGASPGTGGTLRVDFSSVGDPMSLLGQEFTIAEAASVEGRFSSVEEIGGGNVYLRVVYPEAAAPASEGEVSESLTTREVLKLEAALKGDIFRFEGDPTGLIDENDAAVLSAVLIGGLGQIGVEGGFFDPDELARALDFVRSPFQTGTESIVDLNDVPYFAAAMAQSQGMSMGQAMSTFERIYNEVYMATVPEPSTAMLCLTLAPFVAPRHRNRRR